MYDIDAVMINLFVHLTKDKIMGENIQIYQTNVYVISIYDIFVGLFCKRVKVYSSFQQIIMFIIF